MEEMTECMRFWEKQKERKKRQSGGRRENILKLHFNIPCADQYKVHENAIYHGTAQFITELHNVLYVHPLSNDGVVMITM